MTDTTTNTSFDFNDAGEQKSFEVIPAGTIVTLQLTIRAGGAGDDGWLKRSADQNSEGLDCEFVVVDGPNAKRKLWQLYTIRGTKEGHGKAGEISRNTFKAILESARGVRPDDKSEAAQNKRKVSGWGDFDQIRFMARLGVQPPQGAYPAKNTIAEVITPDRLGWVKPEQLSAKPTNSASPAAAPATPPANAISRPNWAKDDHHG
jgi:hypothetical protein